MVNSAAELLPRVLSADGARRVGFTPARVRTELRRGRWYRLGPNALLTRPEEPSRHDWIEAAEIFTSCRGVLSGWDAVRRHGIGPQRPPTDEVLVLVGAGRCRLLGRVRLRPSERPLTTSTISMLDEALPGVEVAAPARAIADTALACRRLGDVRAMVTAAVQRGLCSPTALANELGAGPRNGSMLLRRSLADVLAGAQSVAEGDAVRLLRRGGLSGWVANAPIRDAAGRVVFRADLLWPALRAIVEIDSREFHFAEADWKATMRRHNRLSGLGYAVAHYPPSDIRARGLAWVVEVGEWLTARAASLGVSFRP